MKLRIVSSLIVSTILALTFGGAVELVHGFAATDMLPLQGPSEVALPEQHAGAPVHQVQVVDLTAPSHKVLVIVDGAAYGTETVARADGGGNPIPPEKPDPPEKPEPPTDPDPDPAVEARPDRLADAAILYVQGIAANYRSVGQQVREGKIKTLEELKAATGAARERAAGRLTRVLADRWGQAQAIEDSGAILEPATVADSMEVVGRTLEVILGKRK